MRHSLCVALATFLLFGCILKAQDNPIPVVVPVQVQPENPVPVVSPVPVVQQNPVPVVVPVQIQPENPVPVVSPVPVVQQNPEPVVVPVVVQVTPENPAPVAAPAEEKKAYGPVQLEKVTVTVKGTGVHKLEGIHDWAGKAAQMASLDGFIPPKDVTILFQDEADPSFRNGTMISIVFEPKIPAPTPRPEGAEPPKERDGVQLKKVTIVLEGEDVFKQAGVFDWTGKSAQLVIEWFPIFDKIFQTEGYSPTPEITLRYRTMGGVANASGTTINISAAWIRSNPRDFGMVAHEMFHVIQRYGGGGGRGGTGIPTWAMEGITDFARHAYYEPDVLKRPVNLQTNKYTDSYQITGGFFMWIEHAYDKEFIKKLNQHARARTWSDDVFEKYTGKGPEDLWKEYVEFLRTVEGTRILPSREFGREKMGTTYTAQPQQQQGQGQGGGGGQGRQRPQQPPTTVNEL